MITKEPPSIEALAQAVDAFPGKEVEIQISDRPLEAPKVMKKEELSEMIRKSNLSGKERIEIAKALRMTIDKEIATKESLLASTNHSIQLLSAGYKARKRIGREEHKSYAQSLLREAKVKVSDSMEELDRKLSPLMNKICIFREAISDHGFDDERFHTLKQKVAPFSIGTASWAQTGYPDFDLPSDFFHALAATDFGDANEESLHLPFPAFCIRLPENSIMHGARNIFVLTYDGDFDDLPEGGFEVRDDAVLRQGKGRITSIVTNVPLEGLDDAQAVSWPSYVTLKQVLAQAPSIPPKAKQMKNWELLAEAMMLSRRILVNMLLYINANGGLPEKGKKKLGPDVPVERDHKEHPRFRVGRPIKLSPMTRKMLYERNPSAESRELMARFMVRGHWRNQAHGPNRALRKRMWIEPHWKGPDTVDEAMKRTYNVE